MTEEGSNWQGRGSCFEVLGERAKGVVSGSLDVKEMELLVGETSGGGLFCSWYWFNSKGRSLRQAQLRQTG